MTTPIGYATLQIIPSLKGVSEEINKQLGGTISVSGKRAGAQFGKGVADGLKASEADVKRATDAYGKLADKAKDSLGQIAVAEAKLEKARAGGKQDMIVAAEERLAKVRRDSLRTSKEAEAAHSALVAVQGRLGSSTDDLGGRFSGLSGMASSAGTALLSVGTLAGGAALVGVTAFAAGAVRATKELYDLGASFDDLRDKLQISTGASGAQLEGLVATVERLGTTNVASKFGDIGDVAADVTRNLHLTGPALDDVTSRLANWDRMTGDAVNVRELGKAFRGFGVDAADQAGALDSLAGMSQKTGLSVNELIGAVNKGAPALREFGFSFGESAALVGQLDAAGLNAEKMLKGPLNSALVALRKEGKTGADGLKGIVDQIQALLAAGDQLGARGLAEKYFGTKGAVDFFDAIRSGNLDLANLSVGLQATSADINQLAADTGDGAERFQLLRSRIEKALEPLGTTVFDSVNAGLDKLAGWVESHQSEIVGAFVAIGDAVISMATGTLRGLGEMTEAFGGFISILGDVQGAVLKFQAWQQDVAGHHETADALRKQSEEAFGWGESLQKLGEDMKETARQGGEWKKGLRELGDEAKNAAVAAAALNRTVVDGKQVFGPFVATPFISGTPPAAPAAASNTGAVASAAAAGRSGGVSGSKSGLQPNASRLFDLVAQEFPEIKEIGGVRQDRLPWHPSGRALDIMIPGAGGLNDPTPALGKALGDRIWAWLGANAEQLGVEMSASLWQEEDHFNHIHAAVKGGAMTAAPGLSSLADTGGSRVPAAAAAPTVGPAAKPTSKPGLSTQGANSPIDLSRNTITVNSVSTDGNQSATKSTGGGLKMPSLTNLSGLGGALGEFAGGQLGSALDVFGVGDSPGWLQGISQFMGGISIGGKGGGDSLSPLSALGDVGAAASLTGAHAGTGQQPGPAGGVTYNINNTTGNDDLITLLRRREQELGAMLGRF